MELAELPDSELVWLTKGKSQPAFTELLARHDGLAFEVSLSMFRDCRADAEDAMQNARLACWESLARYDPECGEFGPWYLEIVRRCCHHLYKQRQRTADWASYDDVQETVASPLEQLVGLEECSYLHGAVDALPPKQARAVRMRYLEQCEYGEIAAEMGVTEKTASKYVSVGLANLRDRLGDKCDLLGI